MGSGETALSGKVLRESAKAYLFDHGDGEVWIPKSVVTDMTEDWSIGETIDLFVATWFAEKEGLA